MRKTKLLVILAAAVLLTTAIARPVLADAGSDITDTQADQIRQNCKQAQSLLQRLQTTDVATRVNRGRIYENLINRLIAPFNSRVSNNRYDATSLVSTTGNIQQKFTDFKNDYSVYEDSFSRMLGINCEANPRSFYTLLTATREERVKVADDISALNTLLTAYTQAFTELSTSIEGAR